MFNFLRREKSFSICREQVAAQAAESGIRIIQREETSPIRGTRPNANPAETPQPETRSEVIGWSTRDSEERVENAMEIDVFL